MFKSKLQEFCQAKSWRLPEYSTTREGFDHCPRFKGSVIVNGTTFFTPEFSKSSKDAQNLVAKLAFENLTGSSSASPASLVSATSSALHQQEANEAVQATPWSMTNPTNRDDNKLKDMSRMYKNQLQVYAQKRNLHFPVYVSEREGPPHAPRFKCKVMVEGNTYECQEYFCTVKDAEHAAAKVALMSVSSDGIEEDDPGFCKNLLQELAQKDYSCLPEYSTTSSGPSHSPVFISTVEIKDESFIGQEAKTKKLAEMYAAKVAYSALKERKWKQDSKHIFPGYHVDDTPAPNMGSNGASVEHTTVGKGSDQKGSQSKEVVLQSEGSPNIDQRMFRLKAEDLPLSLEPPFSRGPSLSSASPTQPPPSPSLSNNNEPWASPHPSPARKKVRVFRRTPNMTLPPGSIIEHEDEKWISVTMDSVNGDAYE